MRYTVTAVLLATVLALAGCGTDNSGEKASAKPSPRPSAEPADVFMEAATDAHLDSWADGMIRVPAREELTAYPPQWCKQLDAAHTVSWILDQPDLYPIGENWGTEKSDAYQLVLLGTQAYCPKHTKQVRQDLRDSGEY
ncbi:hypothetical protein [Streptomyces ortus]|uniref:DUF732 domain-containing protein n=1 Tax=Streptomyces ortus TaxID=2867268 RepID=A0ABT3V0I1_9ACTN|nr:hypothetical protein [Streptomyces ortus]MCX4233514.1 hypothetical protein [Streptomyces ortus]